MTTFKVSESWEEGFQLTDDQKKFLLKQNDVPLESCRPALDLYEVLKKKYSV